MGRIRKNIRYKRKMFNKDKLSEWAKFVKKRDRYQCICCKYTGYLHSHHILPKSKFPNFAYELWNGVTLCRTCHLGKNGVHGASRPRNRYVGDLRAILKTQNVNLAKNFINSDKKIISKKTYKPYKRPRRKLYK